MAASHEYKGFVIFVHALTGRFMVDFHSFNQDGYATLNNAKGAITKHIKAQAQQASEAAMQTMAAEVEHMTAEQVGECFQFGAVCPDDTSDMDFGGSMCAEVDKAFVDKVDEGAPHAFWGDAYGMKPVMQNPKHMSRNKREGHFVGCTDGKPFRVRFACPVYSETMYPRTRKQRKLIEIKFKNKQK